MLVETTPVAGTALPIGALAEHLRLSRGFTDDSGLDAELERAMRAALAALEARTGKAILRRGFVQTVTSWSMTERHVLPIAPVSSIEAVRITDRSGAEQILDPGSYSLVTDAHCPSLVPHFLTLPSLGFGRYAEIEFRAGYAETWDGLPSDLGHAALMLASAFFGQDEDTANGLPAGVLSLIEPYRTLRLRGAGA